MKITYFECEVGVELLIQIFFTVIVLKLHHSSRMIEDTQIELFYHICLMFHE